VRLDEAVVVVTPRSYREASADARKRLESEVGTVRYNDRGRALTAAELRDELADADGVIAGLDPFDAEVLAAAPKLRCIARYGIGVDRVDLDAARRHGIVVTNTPAANSDAVAELALALILALLRRVPRLDRAVRAGRWEPERGTELGRSTVGIIGLGRVGAGLARRVGALGARVLAHDPYVDTAQAQSHGAELVELERLLAEADIVSLHAAVTDETRDLIDAEALARMRPGAFLVNTARGELVVEEDLVAALDSGALAGAALDSLRTEPPDPGHPLLACDDVILTPHAGAQTDAARVAMALAATEDLLTVLAGGTPRFPVGTPPRAEARR
jgi:D-3-phosphoglycerate dehydrogenase